MCVCVATSPDLHRDSVLRGLCTSIKPVNHPVEAEERSQLASLRPLSARRHHSFHMCLSLDDKRVLKPRRRLKQAVCSPHCLIGMATDCGARPSPAPISTLVNISNVPAFVCTGHLAREELQMVFRCGTRRFETRIRGKGATPVWLSFTTLLHHEALSTASTRRSHYQSLMLLAEKLDGEVVFETASKCGSDFIR